MASQSEKDYFYFKEFPSELLGDMLFTSLSLKEKGLLFLLRLHAANNKVAYGKLAINRDGIEIPLEKIRLSMILSIEPGELEMMIRRLVDARLLDVDDSGAFCFKKMISQKELSEKRSKSGSKGGKIAQAKSKANPNYSYSDNCNDDLIKSKPDEIFEIWLKSDDGINAWNDFLNHRIKINKPIADADQKQRQLKKLLRLSGGNESLAIEIVNQTLDEGWTGLFELKSYNNGINRNNKTKLSSGEELRRKSEEQAKKFN